MFLTIATGPTYEILILAYSHREEIKDVLSQVGLDLPLVFLVNLSFFGQ